MKNTYVIALALAVASYCAPAFAQHGHGAAGGSGMGGASHASARSNSASTNTSSAAASHGQTMDQLLTKNTKLSDKIASLTGESAQQSCSGFKNLGQCVAAAHVSKNLGISFACLKSDMTGTAAPTGSNCPARTGTTAGTGTKTMSLGTAIQTLSPTANSKTEVKKGQQQANQDLKDATKNS
jgi:hypothetical protein